MPLLIWDLDGTLVDTRADLATAGNAARAAVGLPPLAVDTVAAAVGDGLDRLLARLCPDADAAGRALARQVFDERYRRVRTATTRPYPGILAALDRLAGAGWRHAVATNKPDEHVGPILAACDLDRRIAVWRGGDGPRKPDPGQIQAVLAELGETAATAWMAGDHRTDLAAGAAAGCRTVFCAWGFGRRDGLPADLEAQTPGALADHLLAGGGP